MGQGRERSRHQAGVSVRRVLCVLLAATAGAAFAQYPERPVRLIVPQAAGSATDTVARLLAAEMVGPLGQSVVVEDRPGGALTIGIDLVAKSAPDGYTTGMGPIGAMAINDLIAGHVQVMFESLNSISTYARSGKVKALAVSGPRRSPGFPNLPTIAEAGVPGYDASTWSGVIGPAGIPRPVVDRLNGAINKAIVSPVFKARFGEIGDEPAGGTPEEFAETIRRDSAKWAEVVKRSGAKID